MKIILKIEIEFDSWFDASREPKSSSEWEDFFLKNLITHSAIIGVDDGENQDMIDIRSISIKKV